MAKTKKQRTIDLYETAATGPSFSLTFENLGLSKEKNAAVIEAVNKQYQIWVGSWVLPDMRKLLPDLKGIPRKSNELR